jgi:hypothetical protein
LQKGGAYAARRFCPPVPPASSRVGPSEVLEIQGDMLKKALFIGLKAAFLAVKMGL